METVEAFKLYVETFDKVASRKAQKLKSSGEDKWKHNGTQTI